MEDKEIDYVMVRTWVFAALKATLHKSDHISNWCESLDNVVYKSTGFSGKHKSIVPSANRDVEDLIFALMSLTYTKTVANQVRILEARYSLHVNDQNKNLLNVRIGTYMIGRTAVSYKQNLSRQGDATWKEEQNEWLCQ